MIGSGVSFPKNLDGQLVAEGERDFDNVGSVAIGERSLSECWNRLQDCFRYRTELEAFLSLRALSLVLVSARQLSASELYEAVMTPTEMPPGENLQWDSRGHVQSPSELLQLCSSVLAMHDDGKMEFSHPAMRDVLLGCGLLDSKVCHEIMTKICFHHLHKSEVRFEANDGENLAGTGQEAFTGYACENWHQHYRTGEKSSNDLAERLRQLLEATVVSRLSGEQCLSIEIQQITMSVALNLSISYQMPVLEHFCRLHGAQDYGLELRALSPVSHDEQSSFYQHLATLLHEVESGLASRQVSWRLKEHKL